MIIKSSPELHQMYVDWLEWSKDPEAFTKMADPYWRVTCKMYGLCRFIARMGGSDELLVEMKKQFIKARKDAVYPFGVCEYSDGVKLENQHEDPKRLAWVRQRIADGIKEA
jgi:hypothetical protein